METVRILALDTSTKTGWAIIASEGENFTLEDYGQIEKTTEPTDEQYPINYVSWAEHCFQSIKDLIDKHNPDVLVIEETASGSKSAYSQKILEWIHFCLAKFIKESNMKAIYVLTEQWRRETGCLMTKDESKHNKAVKLYKAKNDTNIAYNEDGKRVGKIGRKHVNVRRANEVFSKFLREPLIQRDEDVADSLMIGYCYHLRLRKQNELF